MSETVSYYQYWGKAGPSMGEVNNCHLLPYHSLDVAAVGSVLLHESESLTRELADFLGVNSQALSRLLLFVLGLHDLGKFAAAFQMLHKEPEERMYFPTTRGVFPYDGKEFRHDRLGWYFYKKNIEKLSLHTGVSEEVLETIILCSLGHHGKPIKKGAAARLEKYVEPQNNQVVGQFIDDLSALLDIKSFASELGCLDTRLNEVEQISWHLAGVFVLCDWLGSDTAHFPYVSETLAGGLETYWGRAQAQAQKAVAASGLRPRMQIRGFAGFKKEFGYSPSPLQRWASSVVLADEPSLFVLEDMTGAGKTEAALTLIHRMMQVGIADGFYFGLPTMATSNAMFARISTWYHSLFELGTELPSIVLAHGAREMSDDFQRLITDHRSEDPMYSTGEQTATGQCIRWLADSRKKALLAPIGVGTIDQALLATLPRRHQSLRLLGLHKKILVVDEVHAADEYMLELLINLLLAHKLQGGSAILLSATLPNVYREKLVATYGASDELMSLDQSFPLASQVTADSHSATHVEARTQKSVGIQFLHSTNECLDLVKTSLDKGQCVAWIRNSVGDALTAYQQLKARFDEKVDVILFHSRFVLEDRLAIERKVLERVGKNSGEAGARVRKVVVATQVLQESLDIDVDVLITDICPIDALIQRMGRLHRHRRALDGRLTVGEDERQQPVLYVHCPPWQDEPDEEWLGREFRDTEAVYRYPGRLWLGVKMLRDKGGIQLPGDARSLIEGVYGQAAFEWVPESLKVADGNAYGEGLTKMKIADSRVINWRYPYGDSGDVWYEDVTEIGTRFSDVETEQVVLVKQEGEKLIPWVGNKPHCIRLSSVSLPVTKSKKLDGDSVDEILIRLFREAHKIAEFVRVWMPRMGDACEYSSELGVFDGE